MRTIETINSEISELKERMLSVKGTETEVYTRIVGYYRSVKNWNKGKRDEYGKRKLFSQPNRPSIREAAGTAVSTATFIDTPAPRRKALSASKGEPSGYYYFYRSTCPNCPPVKNWLDDFSMNGSAVNVDDKDGFEKAASYQIFVSPTVVFHDDEGKEMYRATNVGALDALFSNAVV